MNKGKRSLLASSLIKVQKEVQKVQNLGSEGGITSKKYGERDRGHLTPSGSCAHCEQKGTPHTCTLTHMHIYIHVQAHNLQEKNTHKNI